MKALRWTCLRTLQNEVLSLPLSHQATNFWSHKPRQQSQTFLLFRHHFLNVIDKKKMLPATVCVCLFGMAQVPPFKEGHHPAGKRSLSGGKDCPFYRDYTWMLNTLIAPLSHLVAKIKAHTHTHTKKYNKTQQAAAWKMSYSWTHFLHFTHSPVFKTCFHAQ